MKDGGVSKMLNSIWILLLLVSSIQAQSVTVRWNGVDKRIQQVLTPRIESRDFSGYGDTSRVAITFKYRKSAGASMDIRIKTASLSSPLSGYFTNNVWLLGLSIQKLFFGLSYTKITVIGNSVAASEYLAKALENIHLKFVPSYDTLFAIGFVLHLRENVNYHPSLEEQYSGQNLGQASYWESDGRIELKHREITRRTKNLSGESNRETISIIEATFDPRLPGLGFTLPDTIDFSGKTNKAVVTLTHLLSGLR